MREWIKIVEGLNNPITSNENFVRWFKNSKVVYSDGTPRIVYHGTGTNFRAFNLKKTTQGIIWFTSDKSAIEAGEVGAQGSGKILELYVSLQKPCGWGEYDKKSLWELRRDYDGAILSDGDGTFTGWVFSPNQLKSVNNRGTFDSSNNLKT
jgi:hypothetical protein